jgi:hypothetical protein
LTSTGSPAVVLDSLNALHGDLGMVAMATWCWRSARAARQRSCCDSAGADAVSGADHRDLWRCEIDAGAELRGAFST